jgi:endoglucanase
MRFGIRFFIIIGMILISGLWGVDRFQTKENQLYFGDHRYHIRGINWFGMEAGCNCPNGLWVHDTEYYMNLLRNQGFNSIRIPFSYEVASQLDTSLASECVRADPYVQSFTARRYLHHLFYHARIRNMTLLLDFHRDHDQIQPFPLSIIDLDMYRNAWKNMLIEYGAYSNLIGIDVKNEPHGGISWNEWSHFVLDFIAFVDEEIPQYKGLYWVEGIEDYSDGSAWGGSFSRMGTTMGKVPNPRVVFSPHVYGVSVRGIQALYDGTWQWDTWFGFLLQYYDNLICIGEIGGYNGGPDYTWHQNVLEYLQAKGIRDFYYWCLNPDSGDTGGVLAADWTTIDSSKTTFCATLQPNPTFISFIPPS